MKFDVEITSENIDDPSPTGVYTLNVHSCSVKEEEWAESDLESVKYNIRSPTEAASIVSVDYTGPPLEYCAEPVFTIIGADGVEIAFLEA